MYFKPKYVESGTSFSYEPNNGSNRPRDQIPVKLNVK